jgi:hypothetical protein
VGRSDAEMTIHRGDICTRSGECEAEEKVEVGLKDDSHATEDLKLYATTFSSDQLSHRWSERFWQALMRKRRAEKR